MKEPVTKKRIKQIICIIIVLMLCNFIVPNYSYAVSTEGGGSLVKKIAQFVCFIPDAVINFLQDMFISPQGIEVNGEYKILYSPGTIFSGDIPAFDINFIEPGGSKTATATSTEHVSLIEALELNNAELVEEKKYTGSFLTKNGIIRDIKKNSEYEYNEGIEIDISLLEGKLQSIENETTTILFAGTSWNGTNNTLVCAWYNADQTKVYIIVNYYYLSTRNENISWHEGKVKLYEIDTKDALEDAAEITDTTTTIVVDTKEYNSSSAILQSVVATWYNALRRIALVGLLSVLVYIGIKIVLSSTSAKDKAKYKSMLKDWLIALCILFALHYVMSITITVVDKVSEVIKVSSIDPNGEDILMSSVRNKIANGESWGESLPYVAIYCVLAVYTVIFTIQYIRRVIYIAFLTMIAPLITLTYPLDKIKDSKSQAFDMWLKDYIFFSLLQVLHLLIYYVFLGSSLNLANEGNWIFAIVAIGFITKAEKIMKKMFGFEKSKSMGALAAGATGALVMNAINNISHKPPKGNGARKGASGGNTSAVRTATTNPLATLSTGGAIPVDNSGATTQSQNSDGENASPRTQGAGSPQNTSGTNNTNNNSSSKGSTLQTSRNGNNSNAQSSSMPALNSNKPKRNIANGIGTVIGRYYKPVAGTVIGAGAGLTGSIIGFASGVAQGDIGKALTGAMAGGVAGMNLGKGAVNLATSIPGNIKNTVNNVGDTIREGVYGEEYANNVKFDREFRNSSAYKQLKRDSELPDKDFDAKVQQMLDAGITDTKKMKKILKNHKNHPRKYNMDKAIAYSAMAEKCPEGVLYNNSRFVRFCNDNNIEISKEELENLRKCIIEFK